MLQIIQKQVMALIWVIRLFKCLNRSGLYWLVVNWCKALRRNWELGLQPFWHLNHWVITGHGPCYSLLHWIINPIGSLGFWPICESKFSLRRSLDGWVKMLEKWSPPWLRALSSLGGTSRVAFWEWHFQMGILLRSGSNPALNFWNLLTYLISGLGVYEHCAGVSLLPL